MLDRAQQALIMRVLGSLNESQARWYVAKEAIALGRGGRDAMHKVTGMSRPTINRGIKELQSRRALDTKERVRAAGGGRHKLEANDSSLAKALDAILDETTAGDPMSLLKWTGKTVERIADELVRQGHRISPRSVYDRLRTQHYSMQSNRKTKEGDSPEERDEQFRYINSLAKKFMAEKQPLISVDTKKKELVGDFKNSGKTWRPRGQPTEVNVHDFPDAGVGKAIPYGTYDVRLNEALVNVGTSHDTADFAVHSIRQWWNLLGKYHYEKPKRWLICADSGGSNSSRNRAWKCGLQELADRFDIEITVCHYPPGTSKWNKIEHRVFSYISINWRGRPLETFETVVNMIGSTTTKSGLKVKARLDEHEYQTGRKVTKEQMATVNLHRHSRLPNWNYTIKPRQDS